jgi:hypothetical protein
MLGSRRDRLIIAINTHKLCQVFRRMNLSPCRFSRNVSLPGHTNVSGEKPAFRPWLERVVQHVQTEPTGLHVYENCGSGYTDTYVGGVKSKNTYPMLNSEYSAPIALLYYTDFKALTWTLYADSTEYGIPFEEFNSGTLAVGYNPRAVGGHKESTVHAGMMKAGLIKK